VDDRDLLAAMLYLWERMKIVVEPTGALGAAGLFADGDGVAGKRVGVVISGGNVDLQAVCRLIG
jgi:threonine dehydratase